MPQKSKNQRIIKRMASINQAVFQGIKSEVKHTRILERQDATNCNQLQLS